jgi:hypothetical protein
MDDREGESSAFRMEWSWIPALFDTVEESVLPWLVRCSQAWRVGRTYACSVTNYPNLAGLLRSSEGAGEMVGPLAEVGRASMM